MTKARFDTQQPDVRVVATADTNYIFICLNGNLVTEETEQGENTFYEYDYNEIQNADIDVEDVKKNPEKYLDYVSPSPKTPEERIAELENINMELSTTVDSILTEILPELMGLSDTAE